MTKKSLAVLASAVLSIGALAFWFYTAPATGCGWALYLSFVVVGIIFHSNEDSTATVVSSIAYPAAAALFWYFGQNLIYSEWVGFLAIIGTLQGVQKLQSAASS